MDNTQTILLIVGGIIVLIIIISLITRWSRQRRYKSTAAYSDMDDIPESSKDDVPMSRPMLHDNDYEHTMHAPKSAPPRQDSDHERVMRAPKMASPKKSSRGAPMSSAPPQSRSAIDDPSQSKTATRFPDVSMQDKVILNKRCTLRVAITQKPIKKEFEKYGMQIEFPIDENKPTVDVLVTAEDFELISTDFQELTIPFEGDSKPIIFEILPKSLGIKKIQVEFFQNHKYIGGLTVTTKVVVPEEAIDSRQVRTRGVVGVEHRSIPPDLTILINEGIPDGDRRRYRFKLHAPQNNLYYRKIIEELTFTGPPSSWVEGLYTELAKIAQREGLQNLTETLSTIGADLYENLFPKELKEIWSKEISGKVNSIMIISDEPWIPWEIIKPSHETETGKIIEDNFLCEDYQLTRWIAGPPPSSHLNINEGVIIAPTASKLKNVKHEVKFLETELNLQNVLPRLERVRNLLKNGGVQLIHFACHGSFDPEEHEQSIVYLDKDERFMSRDISGVRRNFGIDKPFVFINACQTARADFSLVGIGSWADKFISAQASGFLGSLWEVDDKLAYDFTRAFYQCLIDGKAIGDAVKEARLKIKDDYNSTWLAYSVYADPLARVSFD